jgi:hypothetical protein
VPLPALAFVQESLPIEEQIQRATRDTVRGVRRAVRRTYFMQRFGPTWWWRFMRRAFLPIAFALLALLADPALFSAWRREGLRVFATYSCLALYVYIRLLFSNQVNVLPRLFLATALIYGVWRGDFISDRHLTHLVPGRLDDFVLIVVATRFFVAACPEASVKRYAARAIALWRQFADLRRGRRRGGRRAQAA